MIIRARVLRVTFEPDNCITAYLSNDDTIHLAPRESLLAVEAMNQRLDVEFDGVLRVCPKVVARSKICHVRTDTRQVWLHGCDPSWVVDNIRYAAGAFVAEAEVEIVVADSGMYSVRGVS